MIALSFRTKLLLAMMLLVAGVTGATLYVTHQKVQATYLKLFQDQFEAEVDYFAVQQDNRLSTVKEQQDALAKSEALRMALAAGDPAGVYKVATNQLNQQPMAGPRSSRPRARANNVPMFNMGNALRNNRNYFFRVMDPKGSILHMTDPRTALGTGARGKLEQQLAEVFKRHPG